MDTWTGTCIMFAFIALVEVVTKDLQEPWLLFQYHKMLSTTFARNENIVLRLSIIRYYSQNICKTNYIKIIRYYYCPRVLSQSALCRCSLLAACTLLWRRWGRKQNRTFETISILCSVILIIFMITLITIMILEGGKRGPMAWTSISSQANNFPFPLFLYFFFQSHSQPAIAQVNCLDQKNISFCNKFYEGCDLPPVHTSWRWLSGSSFSILKMEKRFQLQNWHIIAFILKQDSEPPDILHPVHYSLLCVLFHRASNFW